MYRQHHQLQRDHADPETVVWDVRSHGEYTGEVTRGNKRSGHIPNAVHLEWLELVDDNSHLLKPADEVRRILETKGISAYYSNRYGWTLRRDTE